MEKISYIQEIPAFRRPLESDIKLLAYDFWTERGRTDGNDLEDYYQAEHVLTHLANNEWDRFYHLVVALRGQNDPPSSPSGI